MGIPFSHYSGCGNDFVLIDDRKMPFFAQNPGLIQELCIKGSQVADHVIDGLILVQSSATCQFKMKFFNNDGFEASMCGNGVRALARFVKEKLDCKQTNYLLETKKRCLSIEVLDDLYCVDMGAVGELGFNIQLDFEGTTWQFNHFDTGVPHLVTFVSDIEALDVVKIGSFFRHHAHFQPHGANINFVEIATSKIRTYERGVENETLACGTGATACAYALYKIAKKKLPIRLQVRSGDFLEIDFTASDFAKMTGPATWIHDGTFFIDENKKLSSVTFL